MLSSEYEHLKLVSAKTEKLPNDQLVSIDAIYRVFHHGERQRGDTHRFAQTEDPEDFMSYVIIKFIFLILNLFNNVFFLIKINSKESVLFSLKSMETCKTKNI